MSYALRVGEPVLPVGLGRVGAPLKSVAGAAKANRTLLPAMTDITDLIRRAGQSDEANAELWRAIYDSLKHIARGRLSSDYRAAAMDTGTLINDSYLRMQNIGERVFPSRGHFFSYASQVMRSVIVDRLRKLQADRRGGPDVQHDTFNTNVEQDIAACSEGIAVNDALEALAVAEPRLAKVVEMRYFADLSDVDIAESLGVTERTVRRDWVKAKLLLRALMKDDAPAIGRS